MDAPATNSKPALPTDVSRLGGVMALTLFSALLLVSLLIVLRRLAGAMHIGPGWNVALFAVVLPLTAFGARRALLPYLAPLPASLLLALPTVALFSFAVALSDQRAPGIAGAVWLLVLAEEMIWWYAWRGRSTNGTDAVERATSSERHGDARVEDLVSDTPRNGHTPSGNGHTPNGKGTNGKGTPRHGHEDTQPEVRQLGLRDAWPRQTARPEVAGTQDGPGPPSFDDETEETLAPQTTQLFERTGVSGGESISGQLRIRFEPAEQTRDIYVSFCPPLATQPHAELWYLGGADCSVKLVEVCTYGIHAEARRKRPVDASAEVLLQIIASETRGEAHDEVDG